MLKKLLTTIAIFGTCLSTSFAIGSFYIGPSVSYVDLKGSDISYDAIVPAFNIGYGTWVRDWVYLALEGFASPKSFNINNSNNNKSELKMDYTFGISLVPMINLDDTIFALARIGYVRTKFPNLDSTPGAYEVGLGLQGVLIDCWDLRAEANYIKYRSESEVGSLHATEFSLTVLYTLDSILS